MNSKTMPPLHKVAVGVILVVGLLLSLRLVMTAKSAMFRPPPIETKSERQERLRKAYLAEKEFSRQEWIKSGKKIPPGGFDVIWESMTKGTELADLGEEVESPTLQPQTRSR